MPALTPIGHRGGLRFIWQCPSCRAIWQEEQVSGEQCPACDKNGEAAR
jgi:rubrerythrin